MQVHDSLTHAHDLRLVLQGQVWQLIGEQPREVGDQLHSALRVEGLVQLGQRRLFVASSHRAVLLPVQRFSSVGILALL